jgi:putative DNA primase/helicase
MNVFETLREQVDIAVLVGRYTPVRDAGRLKKFCCLIHKEDTPSCFIYQDDYFHCYGCGAHGDVIELWAAIKGLGPGIEAALDLAREYNITLPDRDLEAQKKAVEQRRKETTFEAQARAYHQALSFHSRIAEWWKSRGFDEELCEQFLLGSDSDGSSATFPFLNRGRVKGVVLRRLDGEPKYCNPNAEDFPDAPKPLFNVGPGSGDIHLVEGPIDALSFAALDFRSVAICSTGISENQKAELQKLKGKIYIFPDADEPGAKAGRVLVKEFYPRARLCPARYGEGRKDVNDLFAADGEKAKAVLEELKGKSQDALDLALSEVPKGNQRERYLYFRDEVLSLLQKIEDEGECMATANDAAKALGLKATDVRRALKPQAKAEEPKESTELVLHEPELWPEPVDGARLLDEIAATIGRFLSASGHTFKTVALWVVYCYAFDIFDTSPLLAIVSPEKRCGKTTLLTLLNALVPRPLAIANITASALFRTVEKYRPTLLIDEADSFLTDNEELRGILNSGHRKATAYVIRTTGEEHEPRRFTTWTPKAIALIGALQSTLEDRSVIIRLQRKRANDSTERLRYDGLGELEHLRRRAARWIDDAKEALRSANPDIPAEVTNDRARDNWLPLLAIADLAGGYWPAQAREIAVACSNVEPETESNKVLLLRDLKTLFDERGERLESEKIVTALIEIEGRPWAEGRNGKPITKTGLAKLLRPFGITPKHWRNADNTKRGYLRSDFAEVFDRYIDFQTAQTAHATESTTYSQSQTAQGSSSVPFGNNGKSSEINAVPSVPIADAPFDMQVEGIV